MDPKHTFEKIHAVSESSRNKFEESLRGPAKMYSFGYQFRKSFDSVIGYFKSKFFYIN